MKKNFKPLTLPGKLTAIALALSSITCAPQAAAAGFNARDTSVQMFHWKWTDIAKECSSFLGPQGYGGVQISPPSAANRGSNWWDIYQPVDYTNFTSKMGNEAELKSMINSCHAAGVRVYADIVVNHMAAGSGTATNGATWNAGSLTYPRFSANDFHANCDILGSDYNNNRNGVTQCRLVGLPDLNTGSSYVQGQVKNYLTTLIAMGMDGFRFDAAKHIQQAELQTMVNGVTHVTTAGEPLWITQEIITDGTVDRNSYLSIGTINEFKYATAMRETFRNLNGANISQIRSIMGTPGNWGGTWGFISDSSKATVFINNWDTERNGSTLNQTYGSTYTLANVFMLAWPYGSPNVHSGYSFTNFDAGPPNGGTVTACYTQGWTCQHAWQPIANMVGFRNAVQGTAVTNWWSNSNNAIAFGRGSLGYVVINRESSAVNRTFQTSLPAGTYCDVEHGDPGANGACSGPTYTVAANGTFSANVGAGQSLALYVGASGGGVPVAAGVSFAVNATTVTGQNIYVVGNSALIGNWDTSKAVKLSSNSYPVWKVSVALPAGTAFQYKYIRKDAAGAVTWESGANRSATVPANGVLTLSDTWRN